IRLGVWLPNPGNMPRSGPVAVANPRPRYSLYELVGRHTIRSRYLYVTDGGHYENLGLVELLRRRCTLIYCFDAAGGDVDRYSTLGEAIAIARAEEGIEVVIDPSVMRPPDQERLYPTTCVTGLIRYPARSGE